MITGRLITAGRIATCENYSETTYGENLDIDVISGVLIVMDDNNVRAAAASMLGKEIEVRLPAPSDRASIVAFLTAEADRLAAASRSARGLYPVSHVVKNYDALNRYCDGLMAQSETIRDLAVQIKRGDDVSATAAPA